VGALGVNLDGALGGGLIGDRGGEDWRRRRERRGPGRGFVAMRATGGKYQLHGLIENIDKGHN
jgi:hypothetical protein